MIIFLDEDNYQLVCTDLIKQKSYFIPLNDMQSIQHVIDQHDLYYVSSADYTQNKVLLDFIQKNYAYKKEFVATSNTINNPSENISDRMYVRSLRGRAICPYGGDVYIISKGPLHCKDISKIPKDVYEQSVKKLIENGTLELINEKRKQEIDQEYNNKSQMREMFDPRSRNNLLVGSGGSGEAAEIASGGLGSDDDGHIQIDLSKEK